MKYLLRKRAGLFGLGLLLVLLGAAGAFAQVQTPLAGSAIPQFVDPLPGLELIVSQTDPNTLQPVPITLEMKEFQAPVLSTGTLPGNPMTSVWGYLQPGATGRPSYIGPVIVATRGQPTEIKYVNNLGTTLSTNILAWKNSTDQTLHWADPLHVGTPDSNMGNHMVVAGQLPDPTKYWSQNYAGPIPAVPHLHGGEVPPVLDGGPDAWFTSDGAYKGTGYYTKAGALGNEAIYRYPNSQEAAPLWFHDHTLGATRLNVYAGLAGGYLLVDPVNDPANLPTPIVPLVVQDRMFDTTGQLYFPAGIPFTPNPEHPFWVPEFVGDSIVVNGKTWPYLSVEPRRYRFIMINGSNARTYELYLVNQVTGAAGPSIWQIGTDGGYLDAPALVKKLLIMPGERADFIIDFGGLPIGTTLMMKNTAKTPFPGGAAPNGSTLGRIMQFRVNLPLGAADTSFNPAAPGATLRKTPIARLVDPVAGTLAVGVVPAKTRELTLNEVLNPPILVGGVAYPGGPTEILVNNTKWSGEQAISQGPGNPDLLQPRAQNDFTAVTIGGATAYYSEVPNEGDIELWEIVNLTADAHPIHTHLVQFQIMNRQNFDVKGYNAAYAAAFPGMVYLPAYGPPLNYATGNPRAVGGNPDVTPFLKGKIQPPAANEAGWKDTFMVPPGMVSRFVVRWAPIELATGLDPMQYKYPFDPSAGGHGYVWHCHIIDHEDNEMMRPTFVNPQLGGAARTFVQGPNGY